MSSLTNSKAWTALKTHFQHIQNESMRESFRKDPDRFKKFSLQLDDIIFDYSKNRINEETIALLVELAETQGLKQKIEAMFNGEIINTTEHRAVLHTALRNRSNAPIYVDGKDVMPDINRILAKMHTFCEAVRSGDWKGYSGKAITDIVS
ncbi:MAG TPA: glucose-6-phosphate isomerase, partial [Nitrosomonas sp.]|nr:glucose-6-phosphate isomerase [Nitrosomonas sp.]